MIDFSSTKIWLIIALELNLSSGVESRIAFRWRVDDNNGNKRTSD